MTTREEILKDYRGLHGGFEPSYEERGRWMRTWFDLHYYPILENISRDKTILEIGCGQGHFVRSLREMGFTQPIGLVDSCKEDLNVAIQNNPFTYKAYPEHSFDVVICKAVLEHVEKLNVGKFLKAIENQMNPGGTAIIEVPNMDFIFASHERYMDFTHEIGFTEQSLAAVLKTVFSEVKILRAEDPGLKWKGKLLRPIAWKVLNWMTGWTCPNSYWARGLIGVCKND